MKTNGWPCYVVVTSRWGFLAGWSSPFPSPTLSMSPSVGGGGGERTWGRGEGWGGSGGGAGSKQSPASPCGSHSLSAPNPDRWREGESWCQEAVTAGGQSWEEGALWPGFVWGGGSSWWSGCWASLDPASQEPWLGVGGCRCWWAGKWAGVSPPPAWDWPCPCPWPCLS